MDEDLLFKIEPIGKLDVGGIRLILNHTEISTDYNETTNEYSDNNKYNDDEEDNEDDEEYKDAKNDNISTTPTSSTSPQYTNTSNNNNNSNNNSNIDTDWLSKMSIDITSDNQMMVIGGGGNGSIGTGLALILTRKLNDPTSWRTLITLDHQTTNGTDRITSIQFVPINLHLINYVVAVGYTSGYLRVFSIQGNLLLSQLFYNRPVLKIKVKNTSTLPIGDIMEQQKYVVHELTLVYPDNIVVNISGVTFMSIVQVCFNQSQRGGNGGVDGSNNLSFKKWTLGNSVERVNDVTFCGPFLGSPFRALPYSTTEQSMVRLVAVGSNPMISFYYPSEDGGQSFSVMISSITSRLTTAVFSYAKNWWGGGSSSQQSQQSSSTQKQPHQEKPIPLAIRWAITDTKREILSILNDPSGRYAVSTDNLGRILLIDLVNSLVVKMWKGYRDCQCGFISVVENSNINNGELSTGGGGGGEDQDFVKIDESNEDLEDFIPKKLLKKQSTKQPQSRTYLVIYLGRRGILEIWGLKHRSREFFKTIGHGCKLISTTTPSIFQNQQSNLRNSGGNNINNNNNNSSKYNIKEGQSHCFIIHSCGSIKEIKYNNSI